MFISPTFKMFNLKCIKSSILVRNLKNLHGSLGAERAKASSQQFFFFSVFPNSMCCGFMYFMAKWLDVYMFIMVCVFGFTTVIQLYHILMFFFPSSIWWGGGKKSLKSTLPKNKDEINKQNRFISQEKNLLCLK